MEERYLKGNAFSHYLGQVLGFIVALVIITSGTFLIYSGHTIAGSLLAGTTVSVLLDYSQDKTIKTVTKNLKPPALLGVLF
ncbi:hypothetical protein [Streptococcus hillyeri]|uniref:hypothetical protein n=1 Tax=Streptococcus hillyeri TaxID=2282420 RepID=UPI001FEA6D30|nr:hypothetical protein [Streptococcus hillyeri]